MNADQQKPTTVPAVVMSLRIAGGYTVAAILWILLSDWLLARLVADPVLASWINTLKGTGFVSSTGLLLFCVCYRRFRAVERSQQALHESQRMFVTLMGNLPGLAYRSVNGQTWSMQLVSEGCLGLTGYPAEDLLRGRVVYTDLIHPADQAQVRARVDEAVARGVRYRLEYRIRTAEGKDRWVWEQGRPVFGPRGELIALEGFITDLSARKRAERLDAQRRSLQDTARTREQVLGVVGHELRTPLASLRAMSELLLTDDLTPQDRDPLLRSIHDEVLRMTEMANHMLESARLRRGSAAWRWTAVNLQRVCSDAVEVIRPLVKGDAVRLEVVVEPPSLTMHGDADAVRRLLLNLLSNACRYTTQGFIRVRATAEGVGPDRWVRLRVEDTGTGIRPASARQLGLAFALSNHGGARLHEISGAGLGLAICKQIAEAHGGRITVSSEPGRGTAFQVLLRPDLPGPQLWDGDTREGNDHDREDDAPILQEPEPDLNDTHALALVDEWNEPTISLADHRPRL